jgi:hypothetical protein
MDEHVIKRRVAAREKARTIISLITEEAAAIDQDVLEAFWDELRKSIPQQPPIAALDQPMTDEQARVFGFTEMPYGEFKGKPVNSVPFNRLEWYADSKFQKLLVRYLNSPNIKRERDTGDEGIMPWE